MQKALKEGPEIVVATPGRMIEMIKLKSTNMQRCTMMVSESLLWYHLVVEMNTSVFWLLVITDTP